MREHLATCSECAAEHASVAGLPRLLALAAPMAEAGPPAPALEERVLDAIAGERPRRAPRRRRRLPRPRVLVPAVAALAAVVVAVVIALGGGDERAPGFEVALQPVAGETASGRALLASADAGITMRLWVRGLPRDPGIVYEVLCDAPGWTASAGTFRADSHGRAYVVLNTAARRGEYDAIRVVRRTRVELDRRPGSSAVRGDPMTRTLATLGAALVLAIAGCGGGDSSSSRAARSATRRLERAAPAAAVSRLALASPADGSLKFDKTTLDAKAGTVTINYDNPSTTAHAVEIQGNGVEEKSDTITGGKTSVTADLKPGTYTFYCPVDCHRAAGHGGHDHRQVSARATRAARKSKIASRSRATNSRRAISPSGPKGSA